jgi:hypothetical protein
MTALVTASTFCFRDVSADTGAEATTDNAVKARTLAARDPL